jgi:pyridoxal phosphate enzyme (YggS family)
LPKIRDLLTQAATAAGRDAASIRLLAVSKMQPVSSVLDAADAGQRDFGENQVSEGLQKIEQTAGKQLIWHFIGHLQANKTRAVAEHYDWVHSVDRLKIAERLSRQRPAHLGNLNLCLQVNIDDEQSKSGITIGELPELARRVMDLPGVKLRGLRCLPRLRQDFESQRQPFARLHELANDLNADGIETDTLSMGMSADYRAAIFEGSTIVRLGTAIFGSRTQHE